MHLPSIPFHAASVQRDTRQGSRGYCALPTTTSDDLEDSYGVSEIEPCDRRRGAARCFSEGRVVFFLASSVALLGGATYAMAGGRVSRALALVAGGSVPELDEVFCSAVPSQLCGNFQSSEQIQGLSSLGLCQDACHLSASCTGGYFWGTGGVCYLFGTELAQDQFCLDPTPSDLDVTRFECRGPSGVAIVPWDLCAGIAEVGGLGGISLVSAKWNKPLEPAGKVNVVGEGIAAVSMKGRGYFADTCMGNDIMGVQYTNLQLLGRRFRYNIDLSGVDCGCNAALYLTTMGRNAQRGTCEDNYCDANSVCDVPCTEIDVQEANKYAWFSTLHAWNDAAGIGGGFGAGRDEWNATVYGPGAQCIDTNWPFHVEAYFPVDMNGYLQGMEVTLQQPGKPCPLVSKTSQYDGMGEIAEVLRYGVTPIVSYWGLGEEMSWMDGTSNGIGPGCLDIPHVCADAVRFWGFSVE